MNIGMTKAIASQAAKDEITKVGTGVDNVARTGVNEVKSQLDEHMKNHPECVEIDDDVIGADKVYSSTKTKSLVDEIAQKGTTVEVLTKVTQDEINKKIADGTMASLTIGDETLDGVKLKKFAVDEEKTSFFSRTKFNVIEHLKSYTNASIKNDGSVLLNSPWAAFVSELIQVNHGVTTYSSYTKHYYYKVAEYDSNKVFIKLGTTTNGTYAISANCKFIRIEYELAYPDFTLIEGSKRPTEPLTNRYDFNYSQEIITRVSKNLLKWDDFIYPATIKSSGEILNNATVNILYVSKKILVKNGGVLITNYDQAVRIYQYRHDTTFINGRDNGQGQEWWYCNSTKSVTLSNDCAYILVAFDSPFNGINLFYVENNVDEITFPSSFNLEISETFNRIKMYENLGIKNNMCTTKKHYVIKNEDYLLYFGALNQKVFPNFLFNRLETHKYNTDGNTFMNTNDFVNVIITKPPTTQYSFYSYDNEQNIIEKAPVQFILNDMTKTTTLKVIALGDSITENNNQYKYVNDNCPNIVFDGTKLDKNTGLKHEGRSGWTLKGYMEHVKSPIEWAGYSPFLHPSNSIYKYYGCTRSWIATYKGEPWIGSLKSKGDELGGFNPTTGLRLTPQINDVMYNYSQSKFVKYDGVNWVDISVPELGEFTFNFAKYLEIYRITTPNALFLMLGTNDYGQTDNPYLARTKTNVDFKKWIDTIIASVKQVDINIKIVLLLPPQKSQKNGILGNMLLKDRLNMYECRKNIIANYENREIDNIFVLDVGISVSDDDYNKVLESDLNNPIYKPWMVGLIKDGVHPNNEGMYKMGKRIIAFMQAIR